MSVNSVNTGSQPRTTSNCIVCREDIRPGAKLCHHCSSYQTPWKNWIPHIGAGIALVTFMASVAISATDIISRHFSKTSIAVVSLRSPTSVSVLNDGGDRVLIESLSVKSPHPEYSFFKEINKTVEKGELLTINLGGPAGGTVDTSPAPDKVQGDQMPIFHLKNEAALKDLRSNLGKNLHTFPGEGIIFFRSTSSPNDHKKIFQLEGYLTKSQQQPLK